MLRFSFKNYSLGAKSSFAPFANAALQLSDLQRQHYEIAIKDAKRTNPQTEAGKKFFKEYQQQRYQEIEEEEEDHDSEIQRLTSTREDRIRQAQAAEIKQEFLEKLEELRPLFHAAQSLQSSRMYNVRLYKSLKYFKLYDDPLFVQLSAILGHLGKNRMTRRGNGLVFLGEQQQEGEEGDGGMMMDDDDQVLHQQSDRKQRRSDIMSAMKNYDPLAELKSREKKIMSTSSRVSADEDEDEHGRDFTNVGDMSRIAEYDEEDEHYQQSNSTTKKKQSYFATTNRSNQQDDFLQDPRVSALARLKSYNRPVQVSMHGPSEYPLPADSVDDVVDGVTGKSNDLNQQQGGFELEPGVSKVSFASRGHWVLREQGIAATKDTRKMDPW